MGDPKKLKKKYTPSRHPWKSSEIEESKQLRKEYGLGTRKEVLIAQSFLKKYKDIAKRLIADRSEQGAKEKVQMLEKLQKLGLISVDAKTDEVLSLTVKDVLNRRIQSILYQKGLARSMKQARQFIVHHHVTLDGKDITSPSYLLTLENESKLRFRNKSSLFDENHPERVSVAKEIKEEVEAVKPKEESKPASKIVKAKAKEVESKAEVKEKNDGEEASEE